MTKMETLKNYFEESETKITVLPNDNNKAHETKTVFQFDEETPLGTIVLQTGGIIFDQWVRVYGSGEIDFSQKNRSLSPYGKIIVAEDVAGGLFGIDEDNMIFYFAPDSLEWEELEISYPKLIQGFTEGGEGIEKFFKSFRWEGWQEDTKDIKNNEGILYTPFLWTKEASIEGFPHKIVPIDEVQKIQLDIVLGFNNIEK